MIKLKDHNINSTFTAKYKYLKKRQETYIQHTKKNPDQSMQQN